MTLFYLRGSIISALLKPCGSYLPLAPGGISVVLDPGMECYAYCCYANCKDNKPLEFRELYKSTDFTLNI